MFSKVCKTEHRTGGGGSDGSFIDVRAFSLLTPRVPHPAVCPATPPGDPCYNTIATPSLQECTEALNNYFIPITKVVARRR